MRAGNAFWSLLLQLAAQVLAPGVGDVASAETSRAALAVGRLSHPLITKLFCVFFVFNATAQLLPLLHDQARA